MSTSISVIIDYIVAFVEHSGYLGIFIMTLIEGTLIPIPSELTLIPAGILSSEGKLNIYLVLLVSMLGNFLGSIISYYLGSHFGRRFIDRYGKYVFFTPQKLSEVELFFKKYGSLSVFLGRILPGFKHFIAFPAGIVHMNFKIFCLYSLLGGTAWVAMLVLSGYFFADHLNVLRTKLEYANSAILMIMLIAIAAFIYYKNRSKLMHK